MLFKVNYTEKTGSKIEVRIEKGKRVPTPMDPPAHSIPKLIEFGGFEISMEDIEAAGTQMPVKEFKMFFEKEIVKHGAPAAAAPSGLFSSSNSGLFSIGQGVTSSTSTSSAAAAQTS